MADSKISALSAITALGGTEEFVVALSGASNKITAANIAKFMPGHEIGYTQITARANVTDTSESTATALISPGALTFDGGPVMCIFDAEYLVTPATLAGFVCITLFEGATQITRLALATSEVAGQNIQVPCHNEFRFTPTAGAHTYKVCGFVSSTSGTPAIIAGPGGTAADRPAFVRFTKV